MSQLLLTNEKGQMIIKLFGKTLFITKKWKEDLKVKSLYYRTEIVFFIVGFIVILGILI